ncbi:MAG TPA: DnaJ domain-containing protein [Candidatus Eremiobacteraeota bacterium]|nr:DnaJ domain-containing protein [Candidatus Eremiobacteraeota bacterium]
MVKDTNLYTIMELPIYASLDDIHEAYRKLAKEYHPDLKGKDLEDKMININNAYRILKSNESRDEYNFNELLPLKKLPQELYEKLPTKITPRKNRPLMQTVIKKITGKPTLYTMTALAIRFKTAIMYTKSTNPVHQEMAIEELKKALKLDPNHTDSLYNLGVLYCRKGELTVGLSYFKKFISIEKDEKVAGIIRYLEEKIKNNKDRRETQKLKLNEIAEKEKLSVN